LKFHNKHKRIATLTAVNPPARFGAIKINNGLVSEFKEKLDNLDTWINGGFFIFNKKIFKILDKNNNTLEYGAMRYLSKKKQLMAYKHSGFWHPMDTLRDKNKLNTMWLSGKANWK
jgi:glucose-1-phosphate cytidylyltransferase